ncbi:hypothetical protein ANANG_G00193460, partial [Anguilla anguilla]
GQDRQQTGAGSADTKRGRSQASRGGRTERSGWFCDSLWSLGVLVALQKFPQKFQEIFVKTEKPLTAAVLEVLFKCTLAEKGSNRFEAQCRTLAFW